MTTQRLEGYRRFELLFAYVASALPAELSLLSLHRPLREKSHQQPYPAAS